MHLSDGCYTLAEEEDGKFTLLEELFNSNASAKQSVFYSIDMKARNDELAYKTNALVVKYQLEDKVIWGSMFKEQHQAAISSNPNVSVFYDGSNAVKLYLCWLFGCVFCCRLKGDVLMTTHMTSRQQQRIKNMLARRGRKGCLVNCVICIARCVHRC